MGTFYAVLLMDVGGQPPYSTSLILHATDIIHGEGNSAMMAAFGSMVVADAPRQQMRSHHIPAVYIPNASWVNRVITRLLYIYIYIHRLNILCVIIVHALDISWILLDMNPCFASLLLQVAVEGPRTPKGSAV